MYVPDIQIGYTPPRRCIYKTNTHTRVRGIHSAHTSAEDNSAPHTHTAQCGEQKTERRIVVMNKRTCETKERIIITTK